MSSPSPENNQFLGGSRAGGGGGGGGGGRVACSCPLFSKANLVARFERSNLSKYVVCTSILTISGNRSSKGSFHSIHLLYPFLPLGVNRT